MAYRFARLGVEIVTVIVWTALRQLYGHLFGSFRVSIVSGGGFGRCCEITAPGRRRVDWGGGRTADPGLFWTSADWASESSAGSAGLAIWPSHLGSARIAY